MSTGKIVGLVVFGIVLLVGLAIGVPYCSQGVNRLTLEPRVDLTVMNPRNYIQNYDYFFDTFNEIKSRLPMVTVSYDSYLQTENSTEKDRRYVEYKGTVEYLLTLVGEYNSKSSSHLHARFKDAKLPYRLQLSINGRDYSFSDGEW